MSKIRTTISIDKDLLEKAKKHNIKISIFLDRKLKECITNIDGVFDESFSQKDYGYDVSLITRRSPVQFRPGLSK